MINEDERRFSLQMACTSGAYSRSPPMQRNDSPNFKNARLAFVKYERDVRLFGV